MDSSDSDFDMLDLLAFNCNQLTAQLRASSLVESQEKILNEYLKKVDKEFESINEFQEGLLHILVYII